jgi:hypothetical protein
MVMGPGAMGHAVLAHRSSLPSKMGVPMNETLMPIAPLATSRSAGRGRAGRAGGSLRTGPASGKTARRRTPVPACPPLSAARVAPPHHRRTRRRLDRERDLLPDARRVGRQQHLGRLERRRVGVARLPGEGTRAGRPGHRQQRDREQRGSRPRPRTTHPPVSRDLRFLERSRAIWSSCPMQACRI